MTLVSSHDDSLTKFTPSKVENDHIDYRRDRRHRIARSRAADGAGHTTEDSRSLRGKGKGSVWTEGANLHWRSCRTSNDSVSDERSAYTFSGERRSGDSSAGRSC